MVDYSPTIQDNLTGQIRSKLWMNKGVGGGGGEWRVTLRGYTTGNTATTLKVDGYGTDATNGVPVPNESCLLVFAKYIGFNVTDDTAGAQVNAFLIENDGGTTALIGTVSSLLNTAAADVAALGTTTTIAYTADDTNDTIACTVTGTAAKNIYHVCVLDIIAVTDPENYISITGVNTTSAL